MKQRQVSEIIKNQGAERGTVVILEALVEDINVLKRAVSELAGMQDQLINTMHNVVNGAHNMKMELATRMKKAGLLEHEDDMGVSTQSIEVDDKPSH